MRLMGSPRSSAQQRTQCANVFHLFQSPDQVAELARPRPADHRRDQIVALGVDFGARHRILRGAAENPMTDRKSTRLNSSHVRISYAVFCLKKKTCSSTMTSSGMSLHRLSTAEWCVNP